MTLPGPDAAAGGLLDRARRERILLLLRNRENCRLLAEWLGTRFDVLVPAGSELPDEHFDLGIIDGPSLERLGDEVLARKRAEEPAFLPFLFVALRKDLRLVNRYMYQSVDELIFMPIEKIELRARLDILLRARASSLTLKRHGDELFAALVEQSLVGVYLARDNQFFYVNQACADAFGYPPEALVDRVGPVDLVIPEDRPLVAENHRKLEAPGTTGIHYTFHCKRPDGNVVACEAFERKLLFRGKPARLGTLLDVTERTLIEAERTAMQQSRIEQLQQLDRMKDQFLSILSHELRTPINAIMGFGSILEDELSGPLNPEQRQHVQKILTGADNMLMLVNDLLDMSRIQAGKFALFEGPTDVAEVVEETVQGLRSLAEARKQTITLELEDRLPVIRGDRQRIGQIVANLLSNAFKFTADGGRIRISLRRKEDQLVCEVEDTGVGIAPEHLAKLFQPFTQLDMTPTRQAGGTGLGLSITRALVEAHGGHIGVRSEPQRGSTFWFTLPAVPPSGRSPFHRA